MAGLAENSILKNRLKTLQVERMGILHTPKNSRNYKKLKTLNKSIATIKHWMFGSRIV